MDRFYSQISVKGMHVFSGANASRDYCSWTGITCTDGIITHVYHGISNYGNFDIHSLPSTLVNITIEYCDQRYILCTRALPRALEHCYLPQNRHFGSVDLRTLPENLIGLDLSFNLLNGPIDLTNLPPTLQTLALERNAIRQSVVFYDRPPPNIHSITLFSYTHPKNRIGELRALGLKDLDRVREIFVNFPSNHVSLASTMML